MILQMIICCNIQEIKIYLGSDVATRNKQQQAEVARRPLSINYYYEPRVFQNHTT